MFVCQKPGNNTSNSLKTAFSFEVAFFSFPGVFLFFFNFFFILVKLLTDRTSDNFDIFYRNNIISSGCLDWKSTVSALSSFDSVEGFYKK